MARFLDGFLQGREGFPAGKPYSIEAIEQIVEGERRERVSHQDWSIEFAPLCQLHRSASLSSRLYG